MLFEDSLNHVVVDVNKRVNSQRGNIAKVVVTQSKKEK
jgi:hypothetical protein